MTKYLPFVFGITLAMLLVLTFETLVDHGKRLTALEEQPITLAQATGTPQVLTVLVGQGCIGAAGPNQIMIGLEEDEFTQCDAIDVHELVIVQ